jgi:hypothetical protein
LSVPHDFIDDASGRFRWIFVRPYTNDTPPCLMQVLVGGYVASDVLGQLL